jgi:uncharacterized protein
MNSCLYQGTVFHSRFTPVEHRFRFPLFQFFIDLDELPLLNAKIPLFSHHRWNLYRLLDRDHLHRYEGGIASNVRHYVEEHGYRGTIGRICLLTQVRIAGYVFNPASFYFGYDTEGKPAFVLAEVTNTYREMKMYLIHGEALGKRLIRETLPKEFYISPFSDLDIDLDFRLRFPDEHLSIRIDDQKQGKGFFRADLVGQRRELSNARLIWYLFRYPFLTFAVVFGIHWHALILFCKKVPVRRKAAFPELQKGIVHWNKAKTRKI